jgi:serine/threonine-protein kinase
LSLASGSRLGPYEIVSALGAGGMGEVYRARDAKLNRDVALKVLPEAFALDPDRLARFKREAQVLASLNHPHIAAIYGFEDSGSVHALVLELVEGPTLAERIEGLKAEGKGLPLDEALAIAKQIADALEAAHEQGIIHRDLKPANIKLRPDGTVKVLDFGLAKAMEPASSLSPHVTAAPTITSPAMMTGLGVILGTAAYMSPEQAKGRPADKRSDVWAFGCVLYEMLTGVRPFEAEDIAETLAFVLTKEPDWSKLPKDLPTPVDAVLRRCLVKDRRRRTGDIAAVQFVLDEAATLAAAVQSAPVAARSGSGWRRAAAIAAMLLAAVGATGLAAWEYQRLNTRTTQTMRFSIVPPPALPLMIASPGGGGNSVDRAVAISPDGSLLVYRAATANGSQLMIRPINQLDARPLQSNVGGREPVFSPDGKWVALSAAGGNAAGSELRKVSVTGGPPIEICKYPGNIRGMSWGDDDTILFASDTGSMNGLYRVPASGGEPKLLLQAKQGETVLLFPSMLPGSRAALVSVVSQTRGSETSREIAVIDLRTNERRVIIRGGLDAHYVDSGQIVYAIGGVLRAVPFDLRRLEVTGDAVSLQDGLAAAATGEAQYAVSRNGTLVYVPAGEGAAAVTAQSSLVWVDRHGREEAIPAPPRDYTYPRVSPDGTRLALDIRDQERDIWIWDFKRQTLTRLTFDPGADRGPVWTPDGRRIIYSSQRGTGNPGNIFWQPADGTGMAERVTTSPNVQFPGGISPDGLRLVFREDIPATRQDLLMLTLDGRKATSLIQTMASEQNGAISPDGRWLAYESDESGQYQIYVRPFPQVDGGRWQISPAGGTRPVWARNGRELFYLDPGRHLLAVPVQTSPAFSPGNPAKLFDTPYLTPNNGVTYDVSPDGQRFVMIKGRSTDTSQQAVQASTPMVVVVNWFEELKQRVPVK